jgi:hypothetical protein
VPAAPKVVVGTVVTGYDATAELIEERNEWRRRAEDFGARLAEALEKLAAVPPRPEATPSVRNMLTRLRALQSHIQGRTLTRAANGARPVDLSDGNAEVMSLDWALVTLLKLHGLPVPGAPAPETKG